MLHLFLPICKMEVSNRTIYSKLAIVNEQLKKQGVWLQIEIREVIHDRRHLGSKTSQKYFNIPFLIGLA